MGGMPKTVNTPSGPILQNSIKKIWPNPFEEVSKPKIPSQIQIQLRRRSAKVPKAKGIPDSEIHKSTIEQQHAVLNSPPQQQDSSEIQNSEIQKVQLQILIHDSNSKSANPEIQSKFQSPGTTTSRIHNKALNTGFQAKSDPKLKFNVPYLDVPDRGIGGGSPTPVRSGTEDGAVAKGAVVTDDDTEEYGGGRIMDSKVADFSGRGVRLKSMTDLGSAGSGQPRWWKMSPRRGKTKSR
ncbi:hypothetical protein PIB30_102772 [Stylosanthes scabra]|uniref:Uncharacterized protein n=1 Tax=Stylosanthes scabra TaxID=79078 RepID=A0ABU6XVP7_9FABA|nr:hypothetical protein [Stylosanthes scabra]